LVKNRGKGESMIGDIKPGKISSDKRSDFGKVELVGRPTIYFPRLWNFSFQIFLLPDLTSFKKSKRIFNLNGR